MHTVVGLLSHRVRSGGVSKTVFRSPSRGLKFEEPCCRHRCAQLVSERVTGFRSTFTSLAPGNDKKRVMPSDLWDGERSQCQECL